MILIQYFKSSSFLLVIVLGLVAKKSSAETEDSLNLEKIDGIPDSEFTKDAFEASQAASSVEENEGEAKDLGNVLFNRVNRLFPYFPFSKFSGGRCTNNNAIGTCISPKECRFRQGTSIGSCQGQGACCQFQKSCADANNGKVTIRNNQENIITTASNPLKPGCQFSIPKPKGVCQIKLDFNEFNLPSPPASGNCADDYIKISGATNLDSLTLCGNLNEQHLYLTYGTGEEITLESFLTSSTSRYNIRVSHIRCNSAESVPSTCSQYFTETTADVKSFNFKNQHFNNQRYTVCVKQESPRIQWSVCSNPMPSSENFLVSGAIADPPVTNPDLCLTDFVQIFGGNRQCGNQFNTFTTAATPFLLNVNFDGSESMMTPEYLNAGINNQGECSTLDLANPLVTCTWRNAGCHCSFPSVAGDTANTGFCLTYKQLAAA